MQQKQLSSKNRLMENTFNLGHRFLGDTKHWETVEDELRPGWAVILQTKENATKMSHFLWSNWCWEWLVRDYIYITKLFMTFWPGDWTNGKIFIKLVPKGFSLNWKVVCLDVLEFVEYEPHQKCYDKISLMNDRTSKGTHKKLIFSEKFLK